MDNSIVVIIAAYNAADTITAAIDSALLEPEVAEVIVVDDASTDNTAEVARSASKGDKRVKIIIQKENAGPSVARNTAIAESSSPLIAILDADDVFLPGRFKRMLKIQDWDLIGDNILFCKSLLELFAEIEDQNLEPELMSMVIQLNLKQFIKGNITKPGKQRGELGFLKPLIRRSFLESNGLKYIEDCRLGEDFLLYIDCLANGARMKVLGACGYGALIRPNSLSSGHGVKDLDILFHYSSAFYAKLEANSDVAQSMKHQMNSVERRLKHREVLDIKKRKGLFWGLCSTIKRPKAAIDILRDRLIKPSPPPQRPDYFS